MALAGNSSREILGKVSMLEKLKLKGKFTFLPTLRHSYMRTGDVWSRGSLAMTMRRQAGG